MRSTYAALGSRLRSAFAGWRYAVLASEEAHVDALGLDPEGTFPLLNGTIPVRLVVGTVAERRSPDVPPPRPAETESRGGTMRAIGEPPDAALVNRLRKNARHLGRWAKREDVGCWRAYDADLPEYAAAVDVYECADGVRRVVVSEYEAPPEIDPGKAERRLAALKLATAEVLSVSTLDVHLKVRRRQRRLAQYEKLDETGRFHEVREGGARLLVNLDDYLDTGLFPDHRTTRGMVAELAGGGSLLNLFCYTGAATVRAALAGAVESTSVDLSNTYVEWARRNLELNQQDLAQHRLVRADVLRWLAEGDAGRFNVVFLDPPSFSSSKAMSSSFDVQRDHPELLRLAAGRLSDTGTLVFSTNLRHFRLEEAAVDRLGLRAEDVTRRTIPPDFARNPRIHHCYLLRRT